MQSRSQIFCKIASHMEVMNSDLVSVNGKGDVKAAFQVVLEGPLMAGNGQHSEVAAIWCRHGN